MLSDVAAEQIARRRKEAGLTHRQLAERCKQLGWPSLTTSTISNIETGRRGADGRRRREITIDELAIVARALEVAPVLLIAPLGHEDQIEVTPGHALPALDAYWWMTGRRTWFGFTNEPGEPRVGDEAPVVRLYERHQEAWIRYVAAQLEGDHERGQAAWKDVTLVQHEIMSHGWRVPPVPEEQSR